MPQAVIMAGGPGERFWPLTHKKFPKYRIRPDNRDSLLQETYTRLLGVYARQNIYVVTTREQLPLIHKELPGLRRMHILIEPMRRNTAAAIFLSCVQLQKKFGPNEVVSFFPADHLIQNNSLFQRTLLNAIQLAKKEDCLITVGVKPTFAATGYGYIETGSPLNKRFFAYRVKRFIEKPSRKTAARYLRSGRFLWNGGIFSWRLGVFLRAMAKHAPDFQTAFIERDLRKGYGQLPALSIDYALLEKARNLTVIKTRMDWCDMGSWDRLFEKAHRDPDDNLIHGPGYHHQTRNSLLINQRQAPLVTWGVGDLVIVQTEQGTLVCKRGFSEQAALLARKLR